MIVYRLSDQTAGWVPERFGFNLEVNHHLDRSNHWDWVLDSGASIIRELHPEVHLRKESYDYGRFAAIKTKEDFEAFRTRLAADPENEIPWASYRFDEEIPWMGQPDAIVDKVLSVGLQPLCSIGYLPHHYPEPLLSDAAYAAPNLEATEAHVNWAAYASSYEYHLAELYRFAPRGVAYFSLHNEPEMYIDHFYLPPDMEARRDEVHTKMFARVDGGASFDRIVQVIGTQIYWTSRSARQAADDVKQLASVQGKAADFKLLGPVAPFADMLWPYVRDWLDVADIHTYGRDPGELRRKATLVIDSSGLVGKTAAITEFNRQGGSMRIEDILFSQTAALEVAGLFHALFSVAKPEQRPLELLTFYLLASPSTHRNYKHLLYGDMDVLDWTGQDQGQQSKGPAWLPTFEELELRHATPAYSIFKMYARLAGQKTSGTRLIAGDFVAPRRETADNLRVLTVEKDGNLIMTLMNPDREERLVHVELSPWLEKFRWAVVRETTYQRRDEVRELRRLRGTNFSVELPPESVVQVSLSSLELDQIESLRLEEVTITPGNCASFGLHQTTRLRAIALLGGEEIDVTEMHAVFTSSEPNLVRVDGTGLVQRMRNAPDEVTITVSLPSGPSAEVKVLPPSV